MENTFPRPPWTIEWKSGATPNLKNSTTSILVEALRSSKDQANPYVRDIELLASIREICEKDDAAKGALIEVEGECWQHVHSHLYNIYDFDYW